MRFDMRFKKLLKESKNYNFSLYEKPEIDGKAVQVKYVFNSKANDYEVLLRKSARLDDDRDFEYWVSAAYKTVWSDTAREMTGEGRARKVITTFFEIIKDFIDKFWDKLDVDFKGIRISSVGKNKKMKRKRHRVYKKFSEIYFPNKTIEEEKDEIFIWLDGKEYDST